MNMTARVLASLVLAVAPMAQGADFRPLDPSALQALADKAEHAATREQLYLYAQLVRSSTETAGNSLASGDVKAGNTALVSVLTYATALDAAVVHDAKKLKDAEILLRESAFRLKASMLATAVEDRPAMAAALNKINAAEAKVMSAVFAK